jgi:hypothetical protein
MYMTKTLMPKNPELITGKGMDSRVRGYARSTLPFRVIQAARGKINKGFRRLRIVEATRLTERESVVGRGGTTSTVINGTSVDGSLMGYALGDLTLIDLWATVGC